MSQLAIAQPQPQAISSLIKSLDDRRRALGWSYDDLAIASGVKKPTVYAVLHRHQKGGEDKIHAIELALTQGEQGGIMLRLKFQPCEERRISRSRLVEMDEAFARAILRCGRSFAR